VSRWALAVLLAACNPYNVCDVADPEVLAGAPPRLSETGFGGDGVVAYEPRFALWSDADDVHGTQHDVPSATACRACHDGRRSRVLGYSALQLDRTLEVPGDPVEQAALGYLHANCSHCHNQDRPPRGDARCYDPDNGLDFRLSTSRLASVDETPTYTTAVGAVIEPGRPGDSRLFELVSRRGGALQMPPLGTEIVDDTATRLLAAWIEGLDGVR
jgi:hypothetical protein